MNFAEQLLCGISLSAQYITQKIKENSPMDRILSKVWNSRYGKYLLPLSFCVGNLINVIFYYLGLAFQDNIARQAAFIIGNVLFTLIAFAALLSVLRFGQLKLRALLPLGAVLLFFAGCYIRALMRFGFTGTWTHHAGQFIFFSFPAFCTGVYAALKRYEAFFFEGLEQLGLFTVPAAMIYLNGSLFNCNPFNYGRDFGILSYMTFSYTLMPFLLAMVFQYLEGKPFSLFGRTLRHPQRFRCILIALFWIAIIASGTRGTYFCVVGFCICLVFSSCLHRESRQRSAILSAAMTFVLCFNIFVYAPQGFGTWRMASFLQGVSKGELVTSKEDPKVSDKIDDLVKADGNQQITNLPDAPAEPNTPAEPDTPSQEDSAKENIQIGSRGTLFKLAVKEFQKSPITGMGPMGYTVKYGMYPHNIPLELLCETGLAGFITLMLLIFWAVINLLRSGWKQKYVRYFFLFLTAYMVQANISGDLWYFSPLLCALGYGLALPNEKCETVPVSGMLEKDAVAFMDRA